MIALPRVIVAFLLLLFAAPSAVDTAWAAQKTHVKGYTKKDGTHVSGYDRKAPKAKGEKAEKAKTEPKPKKQSAKSSGKELQRLNASEQPRDAKGRFKRSGKAKHEFEKQTGYPKGRPGYIVDHVVPLACGGADDPSNMQWQTAADAKAKDAIERKGCGME